MDSNHGIRRIFWLATTFNQAGGGERFVLEAARFFADRGIETTVATFKYHERALFEGTYQTPITVLLPTEPASARGPIAQVAYWTRGIRAIAETIARTQPDLLIAESENSGIMLDLATACSPRPYALLIFGQMFQFATDLTKYALIFRRHLARIIASKPGYQAAIPPQPPAWGPIGRGQTELLALARYRAVRRAQTVFTLSEQVRWEVRTLYGREAVPLRGSYPADVFDYRPPANVRARVGLPPGRLILTISRLWPKKRVDLAIRAFAGLADRLPETTLAIGGIGPDEARLHAMVADLGLSDRVRFLGFVPESRLWEHYAACDVFFDLDVADNNIVSDLALALGKPVILPTDSEWDDRRQVARLIFRVEPTVAAVAGAIQAAVAAKPAPLTAAERAILGQYTWERYFAALLDHVHAE